MSPSSIPGSDGCKDLDVAVHPSGNSSVLFATFNMIKTFIGAGVFSIPNSFYKTGFFAMLVILAFISVVIYWSSMILIRAGHRYNATSYKAVVKEFGGRIGGYTESIATFLLTFGAMIAYCVLVADSLPPFLLQLSGWSEECLLDLDCQEPGVKIARIFLDRRTLLTIAGVLVLAPLTLLPDVHMLSYSSIFGVMCFILIVISLGERANNSNLPEDMKGTLKGSDLYSVVTWSEVPSGMSRVAFMNIAQHAQFMILDSLKVKSSRNGRIVILAGILASTVSALIFAFETYIPLNNKITGNIFGAFSSTDLIVNICRFALSLHIMCTYPLQGHVCRNVIVSLVHKGPKTGKKFVLNRSLSAIGIFLASYAIAMVTCDLGMVIDITGGLAASLLALILPAMCWIVMARADKVKNVFRYIPAAVVCILGVIMVIFTFVLSLGSSGGGGTCVYKYW